LEEEKAKSANLDREYESLEENARTTKESQRLFEQASLDEVTKRILNLMRFMLWSFGQRSLNNIYKQSVQSNFPNTDVKGTK
jgi:hypothetical protein